MADDTTSNQELLMSVKQLLMRMPTREDLRQELKAYATKEDLKSFATKEDLKSFATKEDLRQELKAYATKEDLRQELKAYATKEDFKSLKEELSKTEVRLSQKLDDYKSISSQRFLTIRKDIGELNRKFDTLREGLARAAEAI